MILIKAIDNFENDLFFDDNFKNLQAERGEVDEDGDDDDEGEGGGGVEADQDGLAAYLLVEQPGLPHLPAGLSQFLKLHWWLAQSQ